VVSVLLENNKNTAANFDSSLFSLHDSQDNFYEASSTLHGSQVSFFVRLNPHVKQPAQLWFEVPASFSLDIATVKLCLHGADRSAGGDYQEFPLHLKSASECDGRWHHAFEGDPHTSCVYPAATSDAKAATGADFGSRFPEYVDVIKRKVAHDWYLQEVEPGTPAGATVFVQFTVARDGSPGHISLLTPSSSPSLNSSCLHAVQRVDTFGPLPAGYSESSLYVQYHCTYPGVVKPKSP
jgi:TonB family protein